MEKLDRGSWEALLLYVINLAKKDLQYKNFPITNVRDEDVWQEAWAALGKAHRGFNPEIAKSAGAKFSTYAHKYIFHELQKFYFKQNKISSHERLRTSLDVNSSITDSMSHELVDVDRRDLLAYGMSDLDHDEIHMLSLRFRHGLSYREIEGKMNMPYTAVRTKINNSLNKIRSRIMVENEEYINS